MGRDASNRRAPRASLEGMTLRDLRSLLKQLGVGERAAHVDPEAPLFSLYNQEVRWKGRMVSAAEFVLEFVRASNSTRGGVRAV